MRLSTKRAELEALKREIAADYREIAETRSLVNEAVKRTNDSFIAVENKTMRAILGPLLGLENSNQGDSR